jgi:hypothetical protein
MKVAWCLTPFCWFFNPPSLIRASSIFQQLALIGTSKESDQVLHQRCRIFFRNPCALCGIGAPRTFSASSRIISSRSGPELLMAPPKAPSRDRQLALSPKGLAVIVSVPFERTVEFEACAHRARGQIGCHIRIQINGRRIESPREKERLHIFSFGAGDQRFGQVARVMKGEVPHAGIQSDALEDRCDGDPCCLKTSPRENNRPVDDLVAARATSSVIGLFEYTDFVYVRISQQISLFP